MRDEIEARVPALGDLEARARDLLPLHVWDFLAGGSGDEYTVRRNASVYDAYRLRPRFLRDVSKVDITCELLGHRLPAPFLVAPIGLQRLFHPDGELATAIGAAQADIGFILSNASTTPLEEIADVAPPFRWFQLYWHQDRKINVDLCRRAESAEYRAICLTVDSTTNGIPPRALRHLDRRINVEALHPKANYIPYNEAHTSGTPEDWTRKHDPALSWKDIEWLKTQTQLPVVLKGIMTAEDARLCVDHGVSGIMVSNHGGRQLDHVAAPIEVLAEIADAVGGKLPIILDGSVRRGHDVAVSIALGACAVTIGRPAIWALVEGGAAGVTRLVKNLIDDLTTTMAGTGAASLSDLNPGFVDRA